MIKLKIKNPYDTFRKNILSMIDKLDFNTAYNLSLTMETYLLQISTENSEMAEINDIINFNLFVKELKESCSYKNQRACYEKLEAMDNFFFKNIR